MFREMRRKKQALTQAECVGILRKETAGVLALSGDDGYPYAVPLSFAYRDGKIFFHCAKTGHKVDAAARNEKASFCVIQQDHVVPEEFTTYYRSVIAFGKIRILTDEAEKRNAIEILAARYTPNDEDGCQKTINHEFSRLCMLELTLEHLSGKQATELAKEKAV